MTVGCIGTPQREPAPLEPAATHHGNPEFHQQSLSSPPSSPQPPVTQSNRGNGRVLPAMINTAVVPRAPVGSTRPPASNPILPDLNMVEPIRPPIYQPDFGTPGLGSTDPFIHVHFPSQPTQPLAHFQTIIVQTPHRFNIPTTPVRGHRNTRPTVTSPSTAATIRRGLAAISESSDDDDSSSDDSSSQPHAASKKASQADDVWKFFRLVGSKKKGRQFCTFCEYVHFCYYFDVRIIN